MESIRKEILDIFLWNFLVLYVPEHIELGYIKIVIGFLILSSLKLCSGLDWYLNKEAWTGLVQAKFKSSTKLLDSIYSPHRMKTNSNKSVHLKWGHENNNVIHIQA